MSELRLQRTRRSPRRGRK
ncbi:hypothetical protein LINGRAHAP2_LOCUS14942 [Linum grandiflorum]